MKNKLLVIVALSLVLQVQIISVIYAQIVVEKYEYVEEPAKAQEPIYQDPTGVQLRFNDDDTIRAIIALGEAELIFGDRKDIRQAIKKATMRAKAEIAKFMTESIKSKDVLNEITKTVSKTTSQGGSEAVRDVVESQIETMENSANAMLSGVVTLKQNVNKDKKFVTVVVGIKEQTIRAVSKLTRQINSSIKAGQQSKPKTLNNNGHSGQGN